MIIRGSVIAKYLLGGLGLSACAFSYTRCSTRSGGMRRVHSRDCCLCSAVKLAVYSPILARSIQIHGR
jgi:hypothetical protein